MKLFQNFHNFFKGKNNQVEQIKNVPSKLKGKMIKDYTLEDTIVQFQNPQTLLANAVKQNNSRVAIYALQKRLLNQQTFIAYQNCLANNFKGIYPQYLQHVQSANFMYIVLEQLFLPEAKSWMVDNLLAEMEQLSGKIKQKIIMNAILVNNKKKLVYLPPYQEANSKSKFYYEGINKTVFAELFCKVFDLPQKQKKKVYDAILQHSGTKNLKAQVLKIFSSSKNSCQSNSNKNNNVFGGKYEPSPQFNYQQKKTLNQPSQINYKNEESLYPDISAEDQEIMKLISVVRVNPNLMQEAQKFNQMRASSRARHQDDEETKQIKNVFDNTKQSFFEIKVVKNSKMKSKFEVIENQKKISESQFQLYCTTYISIFKHFKNTVKSSLTYYSKGFAGIINAYFITLIGILRRSKLVYALNHEIDVFGIGCQSVNVEFYTGKLKKQLISEAKILTDLRQMIFRCYIPMKTFQIISPYLDDHVENINLTKLQDFCFFYMSSLMRNKFTKHIHFINVIEFMYIILHRNFQIVHFETDMPRKWDQEFFDLRKDIIQGMIPNWNI